MIKTNLELVAALKNVVANYKTLYVMGCFGAPMTAANKKRYTTNHSYNKQAARTSMINAATEDTFGFDCVCLIKGLLWGWNGDKSKTYGGAAYASNGVPDIDADVMISKCLGVSSTGWDKMVPGEAVWLKGHIGVYIGDGKVIECSPSYKNCVQETACLNIGAIPGMNGRKWTKHGRLPYITYLESAGSTAGTTTPVQPSASGTTPAGSYKVGDIVSFTGSRQYTNANAASGSVCRPGPGKITAISAGSKHPYHVIHTDSTSTVYGWVDASDIGGATASRTYTVKSGDSLWSIAAKQLGDGNRYKEIKSLNGLSSDVIRAGQVLKLPN